MYTDFHTFVHPVFTYKLNNLLIHLLISSFFPKSYSIFGKREKKGLYQKDNLLSQSHESCKPLLLGLESEVLAVELLALFDIRNRWKAQGTTKGPKAALSSLNTHQKCGLTNRKRDDHSEPRVSRWFHFKDSLCHLIISLLGDRNIKTKNKKITGCYLFLTSYFFSYSLGCCAD